MKNIDDLSRIECLNEMCAYDGIPLYHNKYSPFGEYSLWYVPYNTDKNEALEIIKERFFRLAKIYPEYIFIYKKKKYLSKELLEEFIDLRAKEFPEAALKHAIDYMSEKMYRYCEKLCPEEAIQAILKRNEMYDSNLFTGRIVQWLPLSDVGTQEIINRIIRTII